MIVNNFLQFNFHRVLCTCVAFLAMTFLYGCNPLGAGKSVVDPGFAPGGGITIPNATLILSISSARKIKLQWDGTTVANITYKVLRSDSLTTAYSEIFNSSTETSFEDSGLIPGTEYFYKVQYLSFAGVEAETPVRSGSAMDSFTVAHITASSGRVDFVFPSVVGAQNYSVRYGTTAGNYVSEVPLDYQGFVAGLNNGVVYYFQVKAKNSSGAVSATNEVSVLVNPQNIATLEFATAFAPTTNSSDDVFSTQAVINARDFGGLIYAVDSTSNITLSAYSADNCAGPVVMNGLGGTTTQTLSSGVATFTDIKALRPSIKSVKASLGPLTICSANLVITPGAPASLVITSGNNQSAIVTSVLNPFTVTLKDAQDNLLSGETIDWSITTSTGVLSAASSTTNASGAASSTLTLGSVNGARVISATVNGTSLSQNFNATGNRGAPASMTILAGSSQTAIAGSTLPGNYEVLVTDSESNPIPGLTINWAVTSNDGSFSVLASTTNASGIATQTFTLGTLAGTNTSTASLSTNPAISSSFSAVGTSGPLTQFVISLGQNQSEVVRSVLNPFTVTLKDALGNPLIGETVDWALTTGAGALSVLTSTTNSSGAASTTLTLGTVNGPRVVTATVNGTSFTQTFNATGVTGAPASMTVQAGAAQTALAGSTLPTNFEVLITDSDGNPIPNQTVSWTVNSNGGSFSGATSLTNTSGIASQTFTLGATAGTNAATATLASNTSLNKSFAATGTVGPATQFTVSSGQGQSEVVRTVLNPFAVVVKDALNNVIPGATINWTLSSGTGTLSAATSLTNSSGVASTTLTLGTVSGARVAGANVDGTALNLTFNASGRPGIPSAMTVQTGAGQTAISGTTLPTSYEVLVTDSDSNPIPGLTVNWTVNTNGGTFAASTSLTNSSGIAAQTLTLGNVAGTNTSSAALSTNATINASFSASGTVGPPTQISISAGQTQSAFLTEALSVPFKVIVKDSRNNLVNGATIDWTKTSGTLSGASSTTNVSGEATNTLTLGTVAGAQSAAATINGTSTSVTFNFTGKVAAPASLTGTNANASTTLSYSTATGATSYNIYRSLTSGASYTLTGTSTTGSFSQSSLTNGTTYYYTVKAVNNSVESLASNEVSVTPVVPPSSPQDLAGTFSSTQTTLTWTAPATGTGPFIYKVYRSSSSGGAYTPVATTAAGILTYPDTGLTNGQTSYYVVSAINGSQSGESAYASEIAITPDYVPAVAFNFSQGSSFQAHNLYASSQNFSAAVWTKTDVTVQSNATLAPDKTMTATKLTAGTTNTDSFYRGLAVSASTPYTYSIHVKKNNQNWYRFLIVSGANNHRFGRFINVSTCTLGTSILATSGVLTASSATSVGDGWCRVSITGTTAGETSQVLYLISAQADNNATRINESSVYVWGSQAERNPGVSQYVPTSTSALVSFTSPLGASTLTRSDASMATTVYGSDGFLRANPHNMLQQSESIDNVYWGKARVLVTADAATAPNGTLTADKIIESGINDHAFHKNTMAIVPGLPYTFSAFVKAGERSKGTIVVGNSTWSISNRIAFDLSTGTITSSLASGGVFNTAGSIASVGNGWYRVSATASLPVSETIGMGSLYIRDNTGADGFTGDGTSGFYAWGAQYEQNLQPSTYVPTTTAARYDGPRFDYDPITLSPRGILIEEGRTNLITYSQDFSNAIWVKNNSTVSSVATTAPDGIGSAAKITESTAVSSHGIALDYTNTTAGAYVFSAHLKAAERTWAILQLKNTDNSIDTYAWVNLSTGAIGNSNGSPVVTVTALPNGWFRASISKAAYNGVNLRMAVYPTSGNGTVTYTGDGASGIYVWGAQLEAGAAATSFIPTYGSTRSRSNDRLETTNTSWYSATAGSLILGARPSSATTYYASGVMLSDGTLNNRIDLAVLGQTSPLGARYSVSEAGNGWGNLYSSASYSVNTAKNLGASYSSGVFIFSDTGASQSTFTGNMPAGINKCTLGHRNNGNYLNGWISKFVFYPDSLSTAELNRLTQ